MSSITSAFVDYVANDSLALSRGSGVVAYQENAVTHAHVSATLAYGYDTAGAEAIGNAKEYFNPGRRAGHLQGPME